jgi:hypothetical protein
MNRLADLYRNHLSFGSGDQLDGLDDVARQIAGEYDRLEKDDSSSFLIGVYSMALSGLAQINTEPEAAEGWLDEIEHRAQRIAKADAHDQPPGEFLTNIYPMVVANLAHINTEPKAAEGWLDEIEHRAQRMAKADAHEYSPGLFVADTFTMALGCVLKESPPVPQHWYPYLVRDAITTLNIETLSRFCQSHEQILSQADCPFPEMHIHLALTVLEVAVDDWPGCNNQDRVVRVSTVLAAAIHLIWQEMSVNSTHFMEIVEAVEKVEDPALCEGLVEGVPEQLEVNHDNLIAALDWRETFN